MPFDRDQSNASGDLANRKHLAVELTCLGSSYH